MLTLVKGFIFTIHITFSHLKIFDPSRLKLRVTRNGECTIPFKGETKSQRVDVIDNDTTLNFIF